MAIKIGGILYPSQEWYDTNITAKGKKAVGGREVRVEEPVSRASIEAKIKEIQTKIPQISARIEELKAGGAEIDTTGAAAIDTGAGDIDATANGMLKSVQDYQAKIQKDYEDRLAATQKTADEAAKATKTGILDFFKEKKEEREDIRAKQPSTAELYKETLAEYGLTPESVQKVQALAGQLEAYQIQQVQLEQEKQAKMGAAEQRGMPMTYIKGEQALVERQYNSKIAAKAAQAGVVTQQIQMERGLWDDARATANQIVELKIYDQKQALADLDWAKDTYIDLYNIMSKQEQQSWDRAYTMAKDELTEKRSNANNVMNLILNYSKAGITIDDTVEEATAKASAWAGVQPTEVAGEEWTRDNIGSYIQRRINEGEGWATIEAELRDRGVPTYTGSEADKMLNEMLGEDSKEGDSVNKLLGKYGF